MKAPTEEIDGKSTQGT